MKEIRRKKAPTCEGSTDWSKSVNKPQALKPGLISRRQSLFTLENKKVCQ